MTAAMPDQLPLFPPEPVCSGCQQPVRIVGMVEWTERGRFCSECVEEAR